MTIIEASQETFNFELSPEECHLLSTGTCSLDLPPAKSRSRRENGVAYCQQLRKLIENGKTDPIIVGRAGCGHLDFCDGQHRACIAQRTNLKLEAEIEDNGALCSRCASAARTPGPHPGHNKYERMDYQQESEMINGSRETETIPKWRAMLIAQTDFQLKSKGYQNTAWEISQAGEDKLSEMHAAGIDIEIAVNYAFEEFAHPQAKIAAKLDDLASRNLKRSWYLIKHEKKSADRKVAEIMLLLESADGGESDEGLEIEAAFYDLGKLSLRISIFRDQFRVFKEFEDLFAALANHPDDITPEEFRRLLEKHGFGPSDQNQPADFLLIGK